MTKNKEFTEVLGVLEDVYGWNDTNELTDIQAELVNDVISVVKKLTIPVVVHSVFTIHSTENHEIIKVVGNKEQATQEVKMFKDRYAYADFYWQEQAVK